MDSMTAKVSCFTRAYHYKHNEEWVFKDSLAEKMLSEEEYNTVADSMAAGISFFCPGFEGSQKEGLRFIVDRRLSPSVLARCAFCERMLDNAMMLGCRQYVLFASGYDTYALRSEQTSLRVFELDLPDMIADKKRRVEAAGLQMCQQAVYVPCNLTGTEWQDALCKASFDVSRHAFGSLLGLSYYLQKAHFKALLACIGELWSEGSSICFDYPVMDEGKENITNRELAKAAGEEMQAKYTYEEMEKMLEECGFLIYEHHDDVSATEQFFRKYHESNPAHAMEAPKGTHYCLVVKK